MHYLLSCHCQFFRRLWKLNLCHPLAFLKLFNFSVGFFFCCCFFSWGGNGRDVVSLCSYKINKNAFRCPLGATYQHPVTFYMTFQFLLCCQSERGKKKEKQRKTGAILAQRQRAAATCGSDSFCSLMGYMPLHYNGQVYHFYGVNQQGEQCDQRLKQSPMALSFPPSRYRTDI